MNAQPSTISRFTVASKARELGINPKIARRRLRTALKRDELATKPAAPMDNTDGRLSWEFVNRGETLVKSMIS